MAFFTIFQDRLFPTAELPRGEKEKIDVFLNLLEESGVGEIIYEETFKDKSMGEDLRIIPIDYSLLLYMHFQNIQGV